MYRLSMALDPNVSFEVEDIDLEPLLDFWENKAKGNKQWLINAIKGSVAASEHGEAVGVVVKHLNGEVIESPDEEPAAGTGRTQGRAPSAGNARGRSGANGGQTARRSEPADPWASDDDLPPEPAESDPWDDDPAPPRRSQSRPAASSQQQSSDVETIRDKFGRQWTLGLPEAPDCDCGEPAARLKAKSKAGKWYTVWKCQKGAGADYHDKCEFSEFPN